MLRDYGTFIRREREFLGMRQRELADGICTVDTISRIENGSQTPTPVLFKLLLERLGVSGFSYEDFFEASSLHLLNLQKRIMACLDKKDLDSLPLLLGEYHDVTKRTGWEEQFFQFAKGWYLFLLDGNAQRFMEACEEAMRVMRPGYRLCDDLSKANLMQNEYRILNAAAIVLQQEFGRKEATVLFNEMIISQKSARNFSPVAWRDIAVLCNNAAICERESFPECAFRHICRAEQAVLKSGNALLALRIARTKLMMFPDDMAVFETPRVEYFFDLVNHTFHVYGDFWEFLNDSCFLQMI